MTYGRVAALAGKPNGARHRGYELQKALLESEDIKFFKPDTINLKYYLWNDPASMKRLPVF